MEVAVGEAEFDEVAGGRCKGEEREDKEGVKEGRGRDW